MGEDDEFFDSAFSEEPEAEKPAEEPKETVEEVEDKPEEAPEPEAEAPPEEVVAEADEEPAEPTRIEPEQFKGYLDEREKRQKAEASADSLQAQLDAITRNQEQVQTPQPVPDMFDDPDGYRRHNDQQRQQDMLDTKLNMSELMAAQEYGSDKVKEAQTAFRAFSPHEQQAILQSPHPYRDLIQRREEDTVMGQIREAGGLDKYVEAQMAARSEQVAGTIDRAAKGEKPKPPPSLAKGGQGQKTEAIPTDGEEFDSLFS